MISRVSFKGGGGQLGYIVPPPPPLEVILDEITCLWLTGYVDYKNQFLAASLNVEITQLRVLYIYVIAWLGVKFIPKFHS